MYKQLDAERGIHNIIFLTDANWLKIEKSIADVSARDILFTPTKMVEGERGWGSGWGAFCESFSK